MHTEGRHDPVGPRKYATMLDENVMDKIDNYLFFLNEPATVL